MRSGICKLALFRNDKQVLVYSGTKHRIGITALAVQMVCVASCRVDSFLHIAEELRSKADSDNLYRLALIVNYLPSFVLTELVDTEWNGVHSAKCLIGWL